MKRLIQDAAKKSDERWCDVKQYGFMEKIDLFKQLLPFLRKIQVSVRRYPGFGWDRASYLLRGWYSVFWI